MFKSSYLILMIYFYFLFALINIRSVFFFWMILEGNIVLFIYFISTNFYNGEISNFINKNFYYFLIQSTGSFLFLLASLSSDGYYKILVEILLLISISIKIGLFPFHSWVFYLSDYMPWFRFTFLLTLQKLPSFILFFNINLANCFIFLTLNIMAGRFLLLFSNSIKELIISSSIFNQLWMHVIFILTPICFFIFFFNYVAISFYFLKNKTRIDISFVIRKRDVILSSVFMFIVGIPPLRFFFFKTYIFSLLSSQLNLILITFLRILTIIAIFSYFKFFYLGFTKTNLIYKFKWFNSFFIIFFFFFIFLTF